MEELLRTYYANLNPQATEEEILAYLQSQGVDMSAPQGIASLAPRVMPESSDYTNVIGQNKMAVGQKPPSAGLTALGYLVGGPFIGGAMSLSKLADSGSLPRSLSNIFASRSSGNVEMDMPVSTSGIDEGAMGSDAGFETDYGVDMGGPAYDY
jgi:hypothetical protein